MLTEQQKKVAEAIVNIYETSSARGNYGDVTVIKGDTGHITYGRSQGSLTSGDLYNILHAYCAAPGAKFAADFAPFLSRCKAKDVTLDQDQAFKHLLKQAGDDPVMHTVQDNFFDVEYWQPAVSAAAKIPLTLPLGVGVVYDSLIHGSWPMIRDRTNKVCDIAQEGEKAWTQAYVHTRLHWLANHARADLRACTYRMTGFQKIIDADNWNLDIPITVQGVKIDAGVLDLAPPASPELKIVLLATNHLVACHPALENGRTRVDLQSVCADCQIPMPAGAALPTLNPQTSSGGVTRVDLRPLMESNGWELNIAHMETDHKIYLLKKG